MHVSFYIFHICDLNRRKILPLASIMAFAFFLFQTSPGFSQKTFTSTQLLANQPNAALNTLLNENTQYLKESKQSMPLVNQMEFRTETDELDINRQEFLFRMSFNNNKARKVQNELTQNNILHYELKNQLLDESKLAKRYDQLIEWHYAHEELKFLDEKRLILEDKKTIYQKSLDNSLKVDIEDLLKIEESLQEIRRSVLHFEHQKSFSIQQLIHEQDTSDCQLEADNWISIETMQTVLNEIKELPSHNLTQAFQHAKLDQVELGYDMEKAKSRQVLDFVQIKYGNRMDLEFHREWALGVGLKIPHKAGSRVKLNKEKLNIFDEKYKQQLLDSDIEERLVTYFLDFNALVKEYQLVEQFISDNRLEETYKKYSAAGGVHPLTLLRIKESILNNRQELKKIEKEACLIFLEILKYKGKLFQAPFTNYLTDDLQSF